MLNFNQSGTFRVTQTNDIYKIEHIFRDLQKESAYRLAGKLKQIMALFMGNADSRGLLTMLAEEAYSQQPKQWIDKMQRVVRYIGPDSKFVRALMNNKHLRLSIDKSNLPPHMTPQNLEQFDNALGMRSNYEGVSITALDWYFLMLTLKLYHSEPPHRRNVSSEQSLDQDDFFFSLTRNPILVLIRKNLQQFSSLPEQGTKLIQTLRSYLVDSVVWKYQQHNSFIQRNRLSSKNKNYRVQIRPNCLLALYLALNYKREAFADLQIYFQSVIESYSQVNNSESTLRYLIRLWLFFVRPNDSIESEVIENLNKSNSSDGWFYLMRYDVGELYHRQLSVVEQKKIANFRTLSEGMIQLFKSENNWTPSFQYFYTFCCFIYYIDVARINSGETYSAHSLRDNISTSRVSNLVGSRIGANSITRMEESLKKIVSKFEQKLIQLAVREKKRLSQARFRQFWRRFIDCRRVVYERIKSTYGIDLDYTELDINVLEQKFKNNSFQDQLSKLRSNSLVNYYMAKGRDPWDIPIAYNESKILYWILYGVALGLHKVTPKRLKGQYPVNLRTFANPLTAILLLVLCYLVYAYVI